jgi:hypothetical protein
MTCVEIHRYRQLLKSLFEKVSSLPDDNELKAHWAKYLCVMVSGYIEVAIRAMYAQYATLKSHPNIAAFVGKELERFQNPSMEKILTLTGRFDPVWERALRLASEGELKDSIDSVVAVRHQIVHGRSVGITYSRIRQYYEDVEKVIDIIDKHLTDGCTTLGKAPI